LPYYAPLVNQSGQVGLFRSHSALTLGMGRLALGAYGNYGVDPDFIRSTTGYNAVSGLWDDSLGGYDPKMRIVSTQVFLGYGITRFLDFGAGLPLYTDYLSGYRDEAGRKFYGKNQTGLGDLELSLKFQYPPYPHHRIFETSYFGSVSIPTGRADRGYFPRHGYYLLDRPDSLGSKLQAVDSAIAMYSSRAAEIDMKMLWTINLGELHSASPVLIHIDYGVRWTRHELPHLFLLNMAFQYDPVAWFHLFTEFTGETRISNIDHGFKLGDAALRLSPGISFTPAGGLFLHLGADINLGTDTVMQYTVHDRRSAAGPALAFATRIEPQYRLAATLGWAGYIIPQDADQDGIRDGADRCPKETEDFDNFEDSDGCPDNDNDRDGISDLKDKCLNDAEDVDGFEDLDGCPDYDNDKDLVADSADQCPVVAEDLDGFEDGDGCPDQDNDRDSVSDSADQCINLPEDRDGFQDKDGCPDTDNDLDNVADSLDQCRDTPGDSAYHGCPRPEEPKPQPKEIQRGRVILRGVNFESDSDRLTLDSYAILERVRDSLREWPEVKVEILGHTDAMGGGLANRRLSQSRAEAVRDYLVGQGIGAERLIAIGKGEESPIADNATAEGRQMNRRVELHRID
jgi:outer membrane protein OmpA-like peptidoglycan-associated protein